MGHQVKIAKPQSKASKAIANVQRKKNKANTPATESKSTISFLQGITGGKVQPKLKIGPANDKYEAEADQMAEQVVQKKANGALASPTSANQTNHLEGATEETAVQRKCSACTTENHEKNTPEPTVQRKEKNTLRNAATLLKMKPSSRPTDRTVNRKEEEDNLQKKETETAGRGPPMGNFSSKLNQSKGSGQPLDSATNSFMSSRFGADFSNVKIHTGSNAKQMSNNIQAKAFTHQNHIYFNQGQYQPNTTAGKTLLAHELTHTIQQGAVNVKVQRKCAKCAEEQHVQRKCTACAHDEQKIQRKTWDKEDRYNAQSSASDPPFVQSKLKIGSANDRYEQEADIMADRVMRMPLSNTDRTVQLSPEECTDDSLMSESTPVEDRVCQAILDYEEVIDTLQPLGLSLDDDDIAIIASGFPFGFRLAPIEIVVGTYNSSTIDAVKIKGYKIIDAVTGEASIKLVVFNLGKGRSMMVTNNSGGPSIVLDAGAGGAKNSNGRAARRLQAAYVDVFGAGLAGNPMFLTTSHLDSDHINAIKRLFEIPNFSETAIRVTRQQIDSAVGQRDWRRMNITLNESQSIIRLSVTGGRVNTKINIIGNIQLTEYRLVNEHERLETSRYNKNATSELAIIRDLSNSKTMAFTGDIEGKTLHEIINVVGRDAFRRVLGGGGRNLQIAEIPHHGGKVDKSHVNGMLLYYRLAFEASNGQLEFMTQTSPNFAARDSSSINVLETTNFPVRRMMNDPATEGRSSVIQYTEGRAESITINRGAIEATDALVRNNEGILARAYKHRHEILTLQENISALRTVFEGASGTFPGIVESVETHSRQLEEYRSTLAVELNKVWSAFEGAGSANGLRASTNLSGVQTAIEALNTKLGELRIEPIKGALEMHIKGIQAYNEFFINLGNMMKALEKGDTKKIAELKTEQIRLFAAARGVLSDAVVEQHVKEAWKSVRAVWTPRLIRSVARRMSMEAVQRRMNQDFKSELFSSIKGHMELIRTLNAMGSGHVTPIRPISGGRRAAAGAMAGIELLRVGLEMGVMLKEASEAAERNDAISKRNGLIEVSWWNSFGVSPTLKLVGRNWFTGNLEVIAGLSQGEVLRVLGEEPGKESIEYEKVVINDVSNDDLNTVVHLLMVQLITLPDWIDAVESVTGGAWFKKFDGGWGVRLWNTEEGKYQYHIRQIIQEPLNTLYEALEENQKGELERLPEKMGKDVHTVRDTALIFGHDRGITVYNRAGRYHEIDFGARHPKVIPLYKENLFVRTNNVTHEVTVWKVKSADMYTYEKLSSYYWIRYGRAYVDRHGGGREVHVFRNTSGLGYVAEDELEFSLASFATKTIEEQKAKHQNDTEIVQPKRKAIAQNSVDEIEADKIAEQVVINHPRKRKMRPLIKQKPTGMVQRSRLDKSTSTQNALPNQPVNKTTTGRGLDKPVKSYMENQFGEDFSGVKVHTDAGANVMANQIQAKAFTTGNHIYFNSGQYQPETTTGKKLLAHELTHTIQQNQTKTNAVQREPLEGGEPVTYFDCVTLKSALFDAIYNGFLDITTDIENSDIYSFTEAIENHISNSPFDFTAEETALLFPAVGKLENVTTFLDTYLVDYVLALRWLSSYLGAPPEHAQHFSEISYGTHHFIKHITNGISHYLIGAVQAVSIHPEDVCFTHTLNELIGKLDNFVSLWAYKDGLLELEFVGSMDALVELKERFEKAENDQEKIELGTQIGQLSRTVLQLNDSLMQLRGRLQRGDELEYAATDTELIRYFENNQARIEEIRENARKEADTMKVLANNMDILREQKISAAEIGGDIPRYTLEEVVTPEQAFPVQTDEVSLDLMFQVAERIDAQKERVQALQSNLIPSSPTYTITEFNDVYNQWFTFFSPLGRDIDENYKQMDEFITEIWSVFGKAGMEGGIGKWMFMVLVQPQLHSLGGSDSTSAVDTLRGLGISRKTSLRGDAFTPSYQFAELYRGTPNERSYDGEIRSTNEVKQSQVTQSNRGFDRLNNMVQKEDSMTRITQEAVKRNLLLRGGMGKMKLLPKEEYQELWSYLITTLHDVFAPGVAEETRYAHEQRVLPNQTVDYLLAQAQFYKTMRDNHYSSNTGVQDDTVIGGKALRENGIENGRAASTSEYLNAGKSTKNTAEADTLYARIDRVKKAHAPTSRGNIEDIVVSEYITALQTYLNNYFDHHSEMAPQLIAIMRIAIMEHNGDKEFLQHFTLSNMLKALLFMGGILALISLLRIIPYVGHALSKAVSKALNRYGIASDIGTVIAIAGFIDGVGDVNRLTEARRWGYLAHFIMNDFGQLMQGLALSVGSNILQGAKGIKRMRELESMDDVMRTLDPITQDTVGRKALIEEFTARKNELKQQQNEKNVELQMLEGILMRLNGNQPNAPIPGAARGGASNTSGARLVVANKKIRIGGENHGMSIKMRGNKFVIEICSDCHALILAIGKALEVPAYRDNPEVASKLEALKIKAEQLDGQINELRISKDEAQVKLDEMMSVFNGLTKNDPTVNAFIFNQAHLPATTPATTTSRSVDDLAQNGAFNVSPAVMDEGLRLTGKQQAAELNYRPLPNSKDYTWVAGRNGVPHVRRLNPDAQQIHFNPHKNNFEKGARRAIDTSHLPDVSNNYNYADIIRADGSRVKTVEGELGIPGEIRLHRSESDQRSVSQGTGEDAGHLVGNRFGAAGDTRNLSRQNRAANQFGTYKSLENSWARLLHSGYKVEVKVSDITRPNEDRPFVRKVEWTERAPDGSAKHYELDFANNTSPLTREIAGEVPKSETFENSTIPLSSHPRYNPQFDE